MWLLSENVDVQIFPVVTLPVASLWQLPQNVSSGLIHLLTRDSNKTWAKTWSNKTWAKTWPYLV